MLNYHKITKITTKITPSHSVLILHVHSLRNRDSDSVPAPTHDVSTHKNTQQQRVPKLRSLLLSPSTPLQLWRSAEDKPGGPEHAGRSGTRREGRTRSLCSVNTNVSRAALEHRPLLVNLRTHTVCFRRVNQTAAELYFFQTPTTECRPCLPMTPALM